ILLISSAFCANFDDSLARNFFMPLSGAAYSDSPQQCLDNTMKGAKLSKQVTVKCNYFKNEMCSGFTFLDQGRKIIGLSFRIVERCTLLMIEDVIPIQSLKLQVDFKDGGKVSKYFNDAFMDVWDGGLGADLSYLIMTYPGYDLWITGHSLGGAIASLASAHIVSFNWFDQNRITLYTFGQPRTGDQKYADVHDNFVKMAYRVVHDRDLVAHAPPEFMKYDHHKYEVWYDNDMSPGSPFVVCSQQEDTQCSDQIHFNLNFLPDHPHYFGINVPPYGKSGCT
ncbi:hypothetical protein PENTCL1PPCAC_2877, partial [Pristionchus entomophagus]